ncbi:MAG: hypothetical protein IPP74_14475 [Alphaproteobacteria bacterium]|nr:hypothetical protein [Alphaproteobacteria bacterium]
MEDKTKFVVPQSVYDSTSDEGKARIDTEGTVVPDAEFVVLQVKETVEETDARLIEEENSVESEA